MTDQSTIEKCFAPAELADLLKRAATFLIGRCRSDYCDPAPPEKFCFVSRARTRSSADASMARLTPGEMVLELMRPDGSFRDWINIQPLAIAEGTTVLEIVYPDHFTTRLLVGPLALPFEPFHLLGPSLPPDWMEGAPVPRVALPPFGPSHTRS